MAKAPRTYGDACRVAHGLDLVGDRWSLLVVRELLLGPKRFTDLSASLPNASHDMLSRRLTDLEESGVVVRRRLGPPHGANVYELTEWGSRLEPFIQGLGMWAADSPVEPRDPSDMSSDSLVLALRAHFDPGAAADSELTAELRVRDAMYWVTVTGGEMESGRGDARDADVVVTTDRPLALADALWLGGDLKAAERAGEVRFDGDRRLADRFLAMFPERPAFDRA
jgi:DNA-binding HxlR family transcriptional regulator